MIFNILNNIKKRITCMMINRATDDIRKQKIKFEDINFTSTNEIIINKVYILMGQLLKSILNNKKYEILYDNDDFILENIYVKIAQNNNSDELTGFIIENMKGDVEITLKKDFDSSQSSSMSSNLINSIIKSINYLSLENLNELSNDDDESMKIIDNIANIIDKFTGNIYVIFKKIKIDIIFENDDEFKKLFTMNCNNLNIFNNIKIIDFLEINANYLIEHIQTTNNDNSNDSNNEYDKNIFKYYYSENIELISSNNEKYLSAKDLLIKVEGNNINIIIGEIIVESYDELLNLQNNIKLLITESDNKKNNSYNIKIINVKLNIRSLGCIFIFKNISLSYDKLIVERCSLSLKKNIYIEINKNIILNIITNSIKCNNLNINGYINIDNNFILNNLLLIKSINNYFYLNSKNNNNNVNENNKNIDVNIVNCSLNIKLNEYLLVNLKLNTLCLNLAEKINYSIDDISMLFNVDDDTLFKFKFNPMNINKNKFTKKKIKIPSLYGSYKIETIKKQDKKQNKIEEKKNIDVKYINGLTKFNDISHKKNIENIGNKVNTQFNSYYMNSKLLLNLSSVSINSYIHSNNINRYVHKINKFVDFLMLIENQYNILLEIQPEIKERLTSIENEKIVCHNIFKIKFLTITLNNKNNVNSKVEKFNISLWNFKFDNKLTISSLIINKFIKLSNINIDNDNNNNISIESLFIKEYANVKYLSNLYKCYKQLDYCHKNIIGRINNNDGDNYYTSNVNNYNKNILITKIKLMLNINCDNYDQREITMIFNDFKLSVVNNNFNNNIISCDSIKLFFFNKINHEIINVLNLRYNDNSINIDSLNISSNDNITFINQDVIKICYEYIIKLIDDIYSINKIYLVKNILIDEKNIRKIREKDRKIIGNSVNIIDDKQTLLKEKNNKKNKEQNRLNYEKLILGFDWDYFSEKKNEYHYENDRNIYSKVLSLRNIININEINLIIYMSQIEYELNLIFSKTMILFDKHINGDIVNYFGTEKIYCEIYNCKEKSKKKIISQMVSGRNGNHVNKFDDKFNKYIGIPYNSLHNIKIIHYLSNNNKNEEIDNNKYNNGSIDICINGIELWIHHPFIIALNSYYSSMLMIYYEINELFKTDINDIIKYDIIIHPCKIIFNYHIPILPIISIQKVISFPVIDKMVIEFTHGYCVLNIDFNNSSDVKFFNKQMEILMKKHFGISILSKNTQPYKIVSKLLSLLNVIINPTMKLVSGEKINCVKDMKIELDKWYYDIKKDLVRIKKTGGDVMML